MTPVDESTGAAGRSGRPDWLDGTFAPPPNVVKRFREIPKQFTQIHLLSPDLSPEAADSGPTTPRQERGRGVGLQVIRGALARNRTLGGRFVGVGLFSAQLDGGEPVNCAEFETDQAIRPV